MAPAQGTYYSLLGNLASPAPQLLEFLNSYWPACYFTIMAKYWDEALFVCSCSRACLLGAVLGPCGVAIVQSEIADDLGMSPMKATLCALYGGCFGMGYNRYMMRKILFIHGSYSLDSCIYCLPLCCFAAAQEYKQLLQNKQVLRLSPKASCLQPKTMLHKNSDTPYDASSSEIDEGSRQIIIHFNTPDGIGCNDSVEALNSSKAINKKSFSFRSTTSGKEMSPPQSREEERAAAVLE
mmetsp:Transcript_1365/g.3136  ORF Transcript_1365/g.3136 Transcript_1365/m.3136 type:complete len:238 (+) Transcript_1365:768-1481(+)